MNRTPGPDGQDPMNLRNESRILESHELQDRIVCVKGFDGNLTPQECLELMQRGGLVVAFTVIRGICEDHWGQGRHKWIRRCLAYAQYSQARMLTDAVSGVSTTHALGLHKKRYLNRAVEVYRSNRKSLPRWDEDEESGWLGWRTLIYIYDAEEGYTGKVEKEYRATWIHHNRKRLLKANGYVPQGSRRRGPIMPEGTRIQEGDWEENWPASASRTQAGQQ